MAKSRGGVMKVETFIRVCEEEFVATYIPIEEFQGRLDPDAYSVEGSIGLEVNGQMFLSRSNWDDLDWFWPSLVMAVSKLATEKLAWASYPAQPTRVEMALQDGRVEMVIHRGEPDERRAQLSAGVFAHSMLGEARRFYEFLLRAKPSKQGAWQRNLEDVARAEREWDEVIEGS